MLDHIAIPVSDVNQSKQFFVAALAPLGYKVIFDLGHAVGMGNESFPTFWIGRNQLRNVLHIAFSASDAVLSMHSIGPQLRLAAVTMDNQGGGRTPPGTDNCGEAWRAMSGVGVGQANHRSIDEGPKFRALRVRAAISLDEPLSGGVRNRNRGKMTSDNSIQGTKGSYRQD